MSDEASSSRDPTECLKMRPKKSILKSQPSMDELGELRKPSASHAQFEETNLLSADQDLPKSDASPQHSLNHESTNDSEMVDHRVRRVSISNHAFNAAQLDKIAAAATPVPKVLQPGVSDDIADFETDEQRERREQFDRKRHMRHQNEGQALKTARELLAKEMAELETDDVQDV